MLKGPVAPAEDDFLAVPVIPVASVDKRNYVKRFAPIFERALPLAILGLAIIGAPIMILAPQGLPRLRALQGELSGVQTENHELERQIQFLRGRVQHLREDPSAVERLARDELGLVRKSEVVFQFSSAR